MTWHLWRILQNPPRQHPLFWRTLRQPAALLTPLGVHVARLMLMIGALIIVLASPPLALIVFIYGVVLLPVSALMFSGMAYGAYNALTIATHLAQEHRQGRYDLLQVTPAGAAFIDVIVSAGCLHRGNRFQQVHKLVRFTALSIVIALSLVAGFIWLSLTYNPSGSVNNQAVVQQVFPVVLFLLGMSAAFYLDHVQSIITGCLAGMLAPYYTQSPIEVRIVSSLLFFLAQASVYLLTLLLILIMIPIIQRSAADMPMAYLITVWAALSLFYAIHDGVIRAMWHVVLRQSHTSAAEWQATLC